MCTRFVYNGIDKIVGFNFDIDLSVWDHTVITEENRFYIGIKMPDGMYHSFHGISQSVWFPPGSKDSVNNSLPLLCIRFSWCLLSLCMKLSCYLRRMCIFSLKSFHIEDIKCLIPCDLAPDSDR